MPQSGRGTSNKGSIPSGLPLPLLMGGSPGNYGSITEAHETQNKTPAKTRPAGKALLTTSHPQMKRTNEQENRLRTTKTGHQQPMRQLPKEGPTEESKNNTTTTPRGSEGKTTGNQPRTHNAKHTEPIPLFFSMPTQQPWEDRKSAHATQRGS